MSLAEVQQWFGSSLQRLPERDEPELYLEPSLELTAYERLEIYHNQYWLRLFKALATNFPTLIRLFGQGAFEETLARPYLLDHPPSHFSLHKLGDQLSPWIETHYDRDDRALVRTFAALDWAANQAALAAAWTPIDFASLGATEMLEHPIGLQPYIHLFALNANYLDCRELFLEKGVEAWNTLPFPRLTWGEHFYAISRSQKGGVVYKALAKGEYQLLQMLQEHIPIGVACERYSGETQEISLWFADWVSRGWLANPPSE